MPAAETWVAIAFVSFLGLLGYLGVHRKLVETLDQRQARIKSELDEARRLREEAQALLAEFERKGREVDSEAEAIIASNTSSIMIAELSGVLENRGRMLGTHWFYPSNIMPLVEVTRADQTAAWALDATVAFLRAIRKKPVVVNDSPGFFTTRFINLYIAEAMQVVQQGICGIREIDEMVKTGLGWPMGVFELLDKTASFDSWYHAQEYLEETLGERYAVPPIARKVFAAGYRGAPALKPGSRGGWYDYYGLEQSGDKK